MFGIQVWHLAELTFCSFLPDQSGDLFYKATFIISRWSTFWIIINKKSALEERFLKREHDIWFQMNQVIDLLSHIWLGGLAAQIWKCRTASLWSLLRATPTSSLLQDLPGQNGCAPHWAHLRPSLHTAQCSMDQNNKALQYFLSVTYNTDIGTADLRPNLHTAQCALLGRKKFFLNNSVLHTTQLTAANWITNLRKVLSCLHGLWMAAGRKAFAHPSSGREVLHTATWLTPENLCSSLISCVPSRFEELLAKASSPIT